MAFRIRDKSWDGKGFLSFAKVTPRTRLIGSRGYSVPPPRHLTHTWYQVLVNSKTQKQGGNRTCTGRNWSARINGESKNQLMEYYSGRLCTYCCVEIVYQVDTPSILHTPSMHGSIEHISYSEYWEYWDTGGRNTALRVLGAWAVHKVQILRVLGVWAVQDPD